MIEGVLIRLKGMVMEEIVEQKLAISVLSEAIFKMLEGGMIGRYEP